MSIEYVKAEKHYCVIYIKTFLFQLKLQFQEKAVHLLRPILHLVPADDFLLKFLIFFEHVVNDFWKKIFFF